MTLGSIILVLSLLLKCSEETVLQNPLSARIHKTCSLREMQVTVRIFLKVDAFWQLIFTFRDK